MEAIRIKRLIKKNKIRLLFFLILVICILILSLIGYNYYLHKKYGLDSESEKKWEKSLELYETWKIEMEKAKEEFSEQCYDQGSVNHYKPDYLANEDETSHTVVYEAKKVFFQKLSKIKDISFIDKYKELFYQICLYQELYFVKYADMIRWDALVNEPYRFVTEDDLSLILEEINRLEEYLENKNLNINKVKFTNSIDMEFTPETFNYTSFLGKEYESNKLTKAQISSAEMAAKKYCNKLQQEQNIVIGEFTDKYIDDILSEVKFYCVVEMSNNTIRDAIVETRLESEGNWKVIGLTFKED